MQTVDTTTTRAQEPQQPEFAPPQAPTPPGGEKKSRKGLILGVLAAGGVLGILGFLALLARPDLVRFATAHGLKRPALVARALRLMGNLSDGRDGDRFDRAVAVLTRLAPAV